MKTNEDKVSESVIVCGANVAVSQDCAAILRRLLDRKNDLENNFGYGSFQDGLTSQKLKEIDAAIAKATGGAA